MAPDEWLRKNTPTLRPMARDVILLGSVLAAFTIFQNAGPCTSDWKFQTTDQAKEDKEENKSDHQAIRGEVSAVESKLAETNGKLDAVQSTSNQILQALPKRWKKK